jgi:DnaJ-domain-containing protein 1
MQEIDFEDLNIEEELEDDQPDPESPGALEEFFKSMHIKNSRDIPALKESSEKVKKILKKFCTGGNPRLRRNKVIDFYKCLDWLPLKEMDLSLLDKFEEKEKKILLKEIHIYLNRKDERLQQARQTRQEYKKRIIDHFKKTVPKNIKQELERMRDYELNLVGHDRNWQHYFTFKSYKKIDEFVNLTGAERQKRYNEFKKDVHDYKNNRDLNLSWQEDHLRFCNHHWDDDIIKSINWEQDKKQQQEKQKAQKTTAYTLETDYCLLNLPYGASLQAVKQNYRKLAKIYHPDTPGGNEIKMKQIIEAYHRLLKQLPE